ncbi:MAG: prepilin-type N-terminal cleavage/methylation domain-containing protein [Anaerohalosphaeraceae bacterium]|nr:prepilin-type N-terminal cleavage/methylation domain-containing protein [Anaerohalosphaeraceae bacterium]
MRNKSLQFEKGFTLVEIIIAMAIISVIFAVMIPQITAMRNSWAGNEASAEMLQNGRVLVEHIQRNLSAAKNIRLVSASSVTNGYIEFTNNAGTTTYRYQVNANYVEFGPVGSEAQLAGPVDKFQITCYSINPTLTATTDVNEIRFIQFETNFTNSTALGSDKTVLADVYVESNIAAICNLVGHWKMDDGSGSSTAADSSGNGNNGTLVGINPATDWVTGIIDGALYFDGWRDYVDCGRDSSLDITGDITIALWLRADSFNRTCDIFTKGGRNVSYSLWLHRTGRVIFELNNSNLVSGAGSELSIGKWHHIAAVRDGTTRKIYIDGQEDVSGTYAPAIGTTTGVLTISRIASFDGRMDDVRLYNTALSAAEIAQLANTLRYEEFNEYKEESGTSLRVTIPSGCSADDLLIAAVATDGDTSSSLALTSPSGWTQIDIDDYSNDVTLGAWYKIAGTSETNPTFSWSGNRQAYGWVMRFSGNDTTDPIADFTTGNDSDSSPTSPTVTTTVNNSIVLRLGAFDDSDITTDVTGLSGHTNITMDKSAYILFEDDFETSGFAEWTTDWDWRSDQKHTGVRSARCDGNDNDMISDNINTSSYSSFTIDFWYRDSRVDNSDNVYLQFYDGSSYDNIFELGNTWPERRWHNYQATVTNSQYMRSNFRLKFEGSSIDGGEYLWIDDVTVSVGGVSGGAGYVKQSTAGASGGANFSLGSANEARMITIAITPASTTEISCGEILP